MITACVPKKTSHTHTHTHMQHYHTSQCQRVYHMCSYSANNVWHLAKLYHWLARRSRVSVIRGVEQYYVGSSTPWNKVTFG